MPDLAPDQGRLVGQVKFGKNVSVGTACTLGGPEGSTRIGEGCTLESCVRIRGAVVLGRQTMVGDHVIVGHPSKVGLTGTDEALASPQVAGLLVQKPGVRIGERAVIRSHSVIYQHVEVGDHLATGHGVMIREHTRIGHRCVFGTHATCDGYSVLGDDVHVGQHAQLSQAARIGNGVFVGGHTVFSDNPMALRVVEEDLQGAVIDDYVRIGLGCVILPGIRIGRDAMIGAGSIVTRDIPPGVLAFGNPCRVFRKLSVEEIEQYRWTLPSPTADCEGRDG